MSLITRNVTLACDISPTYYTPTYNVLRQNLFDNIADNENLNEFNGLNELEKFCFLLTSLDNGDLVSEYLNKTFQVRKFLTEKPKQNG